MFYFHRDRNCFHIMQKTDFFLQENSVTFLHILPKFLVKKLQGQNTYLFYLSDSDISFKKIAHLTTTTPASPSMLNDHFLIRCNLGSTYMSLVKYCPCIISIVTNVKVWIETHFTSDKLIQNHQNNTQQ